MFAWAEGDDALGGPGDGVDVWEGGIVAGCVACVPMDRRSLPTKRSTSCEAAHRAA